MVKLRSPLSHVLGYTLTLMMFWADTPPAQGQYQYQNPGVPLPSIVPLDTALLEEVEQGKIIKPGTGAVVTENTIEEGRLTLPSLWWAGEQYGKDLLVTWLAYPNEDYPYPGRVHLVVNRQAWRETCYLNQYEFLTKMGAIASDYGYNTRLFNRQGEILATYTCTFVTIDGREKPQLCNVQGLIITQGVNQNCVVSP